MKRSDDSQRQNIKKQNICLSPKGQFVHTELQIHRFFLGIYSDIYIKHINPQPIREEVTLFEAKQNYFAHPKCSHHHTQSIRVQHDLPVTSERWTEILRAWREKKELVKASPELW